MPTARLAHFPAAASWSQVYLLLLGALLEQVEQVPFVQVNRHLPEGTIEREEHEVLGAWETTEQLAEAEGEKSEQKAAWSAGRGGRRVEAGVEAGVEVGAGVVVGLGVCGGGGCLEGDGVG